MLLTRGTACWYRVYRLGRYSSGGYWLARLTARLDRVSFGGYWLARLAARFGRYSPDGCWLARLALRLGWYWLGWYSLGWYWLARLPPRLELVRLPGSPAPMALTERSRCKFSCGTSSLVPNRLLALCSLAFDCLEGAACRCSCSLPSLALPPRRDEFSMNSLSSRSSRSRCAAISGNARFKHFSTSLVPGPCCGIVFGDLKLLKLEFASIEVSWTLYR